MLNDQPKLGIEKASIAIYIIPLSTKNTFYLL